MELCKAENSICGEGNKWYMGSGFPEIERRHVWLEYLD